MRKKGVARRRFGQDGFTIIELLISTTIFSLVMLMAVAGILQITRMYYQGVTQTRTQEVARGIVEEISEKIRFSKDTPVVGYALPVTDPDLPIGSNDIGFFCIGPVRYTFAIDRQLDSSLPDAPPFPSTKHKKHVLWVDQPSTNCVPAASGGSSAQLDVQNPSAPDPEDIGRELLSEKMRLTRFEIVPVPSVGTDTYRVSVGVAYGDDDLLSWDGTSPTKTCEGAFIGGEFCATSNLSVVVTKRL